MLSIIKGPYLQWPTLSSMTIMWETSGEANCRVDVFAAERIHSGHEGNYRKPEQPLFTVSGNGQAKLHQLTIENLDAGTPYFYTVYSETETGEKVESGPHPCKTAVPKGQPFSFTVTSETGGYGDVNINQRIFKQMHRYRPDFTLVVGDLVNDGGNYEDWGKFFFGPGRDFLAHTPVYCCPGNHEYGASWYDEFFAFPAPKKYYSFDYGDVHFVSLDATDFVKDDTYPNSMGEMTPGHEQFDFLVRDLRDAAPKWKIVYFHYPPYVSGGYQVEAMRQLCPVMEQYGVDLVFNSHTITYERSHPIRSGKIDFYDGIV